MTTYRLIKLFFIPLTLWLNSFSTYADSQTGIQIGNKLPSVKLSGLLVKPANLSDFKGKPLIINVWASWCNPCREEMSSLQSLYQQHHNQFEVIGISTDDDVNSATAFVIASKLSFKNYLDHNLQLEKILGARTVPLTILVDSNGRVVKKIYGTQNWSNQKTKLAIASELKIKLK